MPANDAKRNWELPDRISAIHWIKAGANCSLICRTQPEGIDSCEAQPPVALPSLARAVLPGSGVLMALGVKEILIGLTTPAASPVWPCMASTSC
jgi:hypothetical protein